MIIQRPDLIYMLERTRSEMVYARGTFRNFVLLQPVAVEEPDREVVARLEGFIAQCHALVCEIDGLLTEIRAGGARQEKAQKKVSHLDSETGPV